MFQGIGIMECRWKVERLK
ncbi:hypothetical protein Gohar_027442 [Gossypium harknessii]|uniref:Uncharacterized protein n=1 Tax=Gossypium harknessii TaxID=34285 RepID=A0A7J9HUP4_9ROSI|nr:hypothetical protein [Gossypium harknessii]